ncbi:MAG: MATE family efflux transporter [Clostridiales bacterium]|nr:MATE family efflux transporter [Clostridiales bacterium]
MFTEGPLCKKMLLFVLPIAVASIIQQLFHSADTAVVGRFVGKEALAAVGGTTPLINLFIEFFVGLSNAANVVAAQYVGQGNKKRAADTVHTAITVALISGVIIGIAGLFLARPLLKLMLVPEDIIGLSSEYLRVYFIGMPFLMLNNFSSAIFRSCGDTKKPLYCLSIGGAVNIGLNLFLVLVLNLGVSGVAWATVISSGISSALLILLLMRENEFIRLYPNKLGIDRKIFWKLAKIGLPSGFLGSVFSISNVCTQSAINSLGTDTVSASSAAVNVEIYLQFIGNAFAQAVTTAVSQNYGANQYDRCVKIIKTALLLCVSVTVVLSSAVYIFGHRLLRIFVVDAAVIEIAMARMKYTVIFKFVQSIMDIMSGGLQGYGYTLIPALVSVVGVCGVRLFWIFAVFPNYQTLGSLMIIYPVTQAVAAVSYTLLAWCRSQQFKKFY